MTQGLPQVPNDMRRQSVMSRRHLALLGGVALLLGASFASLPVHAAWQSPQYFNQSVNSDSLARWWQVSNTVSTSTQAGINDILVDRQNRILSVGRIDSESQSTVDLYVSRHDSDGSLLWSDSYNGGYFDEGVFVGQDGNDNIIVVGTSASASETDIIVRKYDLTGNRAWSQKDAISGSLTDPKVVIGPNDEIFVAATHSTGIVSSEIVLLRFDSTGSVAQWGSSYQPVAAGGAAEAVDIALSSDGTVVVTATSDGQSKDIVVLKYNVADGLTPSGWSGGIQPATLYSGYDANEYASALYVDSAGHVYVAGRTLSCSLANGGMHSLVVYEIDANGVAAWSKPACYVSNTGRVIPKDIVVDGSGNIYIGGQTGLDAAADDFVISLDSSGNRRWLQQRDNGPNDVVNELAISPDGELFAIGSGNGDIVLLRYAADGTLLSTFTDDYGASDDALAIDIGVDTYGNPEIFIGGTDIDDVQNAGKLFIQGYATMRADLYPDAVSAPAVGAYDSVITIGNSVTNTFDAAAQELGDAGSFVVGLYLWPDGAGTPTGVGDSGLVALGQRTVSALPAGQQDDNAGNGISVTVPSPPTVSAGYYRVVVIADINDSIAEYDKSNNILVDSNTINIFDPPDLEATAVSVPGATALPAASSLDIDYTVVNNRSVAAGGFDVGFYLSANGVIGDSDDITLTGVDSLAGLAGSASYSGTATVTIPNTVVPGDYNLIVTADVGDNIVEADETNNSFMGATVLTVQAIPDLLAEDVNGPPGGVVGDPITVDVDLSNDISGSDVTQSFDVSAYLSVDSTITTSDDLLGTTAVTSITADGQVIQVTVNGTVPSALAEGTYYLGAIVDSGDSIAENDEGNNTVVSASQVVIGLPASDTNAKPELIISSVSTPSTTVTRGSTISVSTSAANILPKDIPTGTNFRVGVYLSTDATITTTDYLVGSRLIDGLTGNTTNSSTDNMTVPFETLESITWSHILNATLSGTTLTANDGTGAGASSTQPMDVNGAVEATAASAGTLDIFGLTTVNTPRYSTDFEYAVGLRGDGNIAIYEHNTDGSYYFSNTGISYVVGDVLRLQRFNGEVTYWKNGQLIYTSSNPSSATLYAGTSLPNANSAITDANLVHIDMPPGTYYLGAIVDDTAIVTEVDETNNAQVETDGAGSTTPIPVSLVNNKPGSTSNGGGALEFAGLLLLLTFAIYRYGASSGRRFTRRAPRRD